MDDLSAEYDKIRIKYDHLTSEMENKKKSIQRLQNDFSKITLYAADLQIYVGLQYLEKLASEEVGYFTELQRKGQLDEIRLESKFSSDLKCLINNVKTFGNAEVHSSPCTLQLKTSGEYQVHLSVPPRLTIDGIKPRLKTTLKIPQKYIEGCQILPDGRILILDSVSKSLILFSQDGEYSETLIVFEDEPSDICYIKDNLIAVTSFDKHNILLLT